MISPGRAFLLGPSRLAAGSTDRDCVLGAVKSCQGRSSSRANPLAQTLLGVWFDGALVCFRGQTEKGREDKQPASD